MYWKNVFKKWANESNLQANLEEYESDVLVQTLSQFYAEWRKENGDDHEPEYLKVLQAPLEKLAAKLRCSRLHLTNDLVLSFKLLCS